MIAFVREDNRALKAQLGRRRVRLDDGQRRRLAVLGQRLGRGLLRQFATLVTPGTILRWHRDLVARKWTYARRRCGRPGVLRDIRRLVVRMATDDPQWGYTRIQGALKNVGHRVARSTIANILKSEGIPPCRERPNDVAYVSRGALARARGRRLLHGGGLDAARARDVLTVFVIELWSRRVVVAGATRSPDVAFVIQALRHVTDVRGPTTKR